MFWGRGPPMSQGSIMDSSGKALEHRTVEIDGEELEKIIATAPLDLSGFGGQNLAREADSPLDLSTKTRKNHADSTENREMYIHCSPNYTPLRKLPLSSSPACASPVPGPSTPYVRNTPLQHMSGVPSNDIRYHARQTTTHTPDTVNFAPKMYKQNLPQSHTFISKRQWQETERIPHPPRPDSVRNATPAGYLHSRHKAAASSDEQYYAMIKNIQQKYVKMNQQKMLPASGIVSGNTKHTTMASMSNAVTHGYPMSRNQDHLANTNSAQKQQVSRVASTAAIEGSRMNIYPSAWKSNFVDITQRCSPDSTISSGVLLHSDNKSRMMPAQNLLHMGQTMPNIQQGNFYTHSHTQSTVLKYPRENQKTGYMPRSPQITVPEKIPINNKGFTHTSDFLHHKQTKPSPMHSVSIPGQNIHLSQLSHPTTHQMQRSIIRGTSGVSHFQNNKNGRESTDMSPTVRSSDVELTRRYVDENHTVENPNVIKTNVISNKKVQSEHQRSDIGAQSYNGQSRNDNIQWNTFHKNNYSSTLTESPSRVSTIMHVTQPRSPLDSPPSKVTYQSPLSIAIPSTQNSQNSQSQTPIINSSAHEKSESRPRPFSKKHIIMSAFNRDEGLKNIINNSEVSKTVIHTTADIKTSFRSQNTSPVCPESPKMPTLSPQQKTPLQTGGTSNVVEPPTLDIIGASKHESFLKVSSQKAYFQDKRPRLLSSLPRKSQSSLDLEEDEAEDIDNDTVAHESNRVFSKRPVLPYKKIPIANVAPMIHGSLSSNTKEETVSACQQVVKEESFMDDTKASVGNMAPPESTLHTVQNAIFDRRNSSLFPPQKSIFSLEGPYLENSKAKNDVLDRKEKSEETEKGDDNLEKEPVLDVFADEHNEGTSSKQIVSEQEPQQQTTKDICKRARLQKQTRKTTIHSERIHSSNSHLLKCQRKHEYKNKGFIDFKPEVLVSRTRTQAAGMRGVFKCQRRRRIPRSHQSLRQKVKNLVKGTRMSSKISNKYHKLETKKIQTSANNLHSSTELSQDNMAAGDVLHDLNLANASTVDQPKGKLLDDGTWEIGGTSSTLKQTLRNGKSKGGIMMKLLFRPKKRVRRRSSTQRIGKCKRRSKFRKNRNMAQKAQYVYSQVNSELYSHTNADVNNTNDDDVFIMPEDNVACDDLDPSVDMTCLHSEASAFPAIEVKKLVVCKDTGETILHRAARLGHVDVVVYCLTTGSVDVSTKDNAGYTPLHESCVTGHIEIVRLLLKNGAKVNCASQDGIRPIHDAVENDHVEIVRLLITFGADPTLATYGGVTPIKISHSDVMKDLLEGCLGDINGGDENIKERVWEFGVFYSGEKIPETDVFADLPDDPQEENEGDFLTESERVIFPVVKLPNVPKEMLQSCVLLSDISEYEYFKDSKSSVRDICKRHSMEMLKSDLLTKPELALYYSRFKVIPSDKCHVVYLRDCNQIYDNWQKKLLSMNSTTKTQFSEPRSTETKLESKTKEMCTSSSCSDATYFCEEKPVVKRGRKSMKEKAKLDKDSVTKMLNIKGKEACPETQMDHKKHSNHHEKGTKRKYRKKCTPDRLNTSQYSNITIAGDRTDLQQCDSLNSSKSYSSPGYFSANQDIVKSDLPSVRLDKLSDVISDQHINKHNDVSIRNFSTENNLDSKSNYQNKPSVDFQHSLRKSHIGKDQHEMKKRSACYQSDMRKKYVSDYHQSMEDVNNTRKTSDDETGKPRFRCKEEMSKKIPDELNSIQNEKSSTKSCVDPLERLKEQAYSSKLKQMKENKNYKALLCSSKGTAVKVEENEETFQNQESTSMTQPSTSNLCVYQRSHASFKRKLDFNPYIHGQPQVKLKKEFGFGSAIETGIKLDSVQSIRLEKGANSACEKRDQYENEFRDFLSRDRDGFRNGAKDIDK